MHLFKILTILVMHVLYYLVVCLYLFNQFIVLSICFEQISFLLKFLNLFIIVCVLCFLICVEILLKSDYFHELRHLYF